MTIRNITTRHNKICACVIMSLITMSFLSSCEKDLEVYDTKTCWLNFYFDVDNSEDMYAADSLKIKTSYSFVYAGEGTTQDTVWVEVETMGFLSGQDRPFELEQVDTTANMAVPGKHYVAFTDPSMAKYYVIPANKARTRVPVVVLNDESLKDTSVYLKIKVKENEYFKRGYNGFATRVIEITDRLAEPANWTKPYPGTWFDSYFYYYFGYYGRVKHQFMIDHTGQKWDDAYIDQLMKGDLTYLSYLVQKLQSELDAYNAERKAQGLDVLKEADGTEVYMGLRRYY